MLALEKAESKFRLKPHSHSKIRSFHHPTVQSFNRSPKPKVMITTTKGRKTRDEHTAFHTAYSIQHNAAYSIIYSIQHNTAYSIQHTAYSIQHTAYSIQHTAYSIQH